MSEFGIAICIFSVVVTAFAVWLVWYGERQEKKEKEDENGKDGKEATRIGEEVDRKSESVRYVRLENGGEELARTADRRNDRRRGRKARRAHNSVDANG